MLLPADFKSKMAKTFYDKEIQILKKSEVVNDEGGLDKAATEVVGSFKGNVRFTKLGELQEEIGLVENIDIAITCDNTTDIAVDTPLQYAGVKYIAVDILPYDSHQLIIGRKWA